MKVVTKKRKCKICGRIIKGKQLSFCSYACTKKNQKRKYKAKRGILEKVLDTTFSKWIRARDGMCMYPLRDSKDFHAGILTNSHFYTRNARSTRFNKDNCMSVCLRHHGFLEQRKNAEYTDWMLEHLGKARFKKLKKIYYRVRVSPPSELEKKRMLKSWEIK